jgi:hypothetical protein
LLEVFLIPLTLLPPTFHLQHSHHQGEADPVVADFQEAVAEAVEVEAGK